MERCKEIFPYGLPIVEVLSPLSSGTAILGEAIQELWMQLGFVLQILLPSFC